MTEKEKIEYQAIKAQITVLQARARELNPYAELKNISNKQFGEGWSEPYIRSKVSNLEKNNGAGHDMRGKHYFNIEVKSCRMPFKDRWTMNQIHPNQADAYLFVWYNCDEGTEEICFIPTKDLLQKCTKSRQHGDGCFTVSASIANRKVLKDYMVSSWEELNGMV